jgi:hypothetical protein
MHITKPGNNIFADLGFDAAEALSLQTQSKRIISEKLAIDALGKHVQFTVQ